VCGTFALAHPFEVRDVEVQLAPDRA